MTAGRMFSKAMIDSDTFLVMPLSAQALYFHLSMRTDGDGFVSSPRKIQRMIGADDDDMKMLVAKQLIVPSEGGVIVRSHCFLHKQMSHEQYMQQRCDYFNEKVEGDLNKRDGYHCDYCRNRGYIAVIRDGFMVGKDCPKCSAIRKTINRLAQKNDISKKQQSFSGSRNISKRRGASEKL